MAFATPASRDLFESDYRAALVKCNEATTPKTRKSKAKIVNLWYEYCKEVHQSLALRDITDPEARLSHLLAFGLRYRRGGQTGKPVRAGTVKKALLAVGQGITHLGLSDPRKLSGSSDFHPLLVSFFKTLEDEDGPATRAYPANITILQGILEALEFEHDVHGPFNRHVLDLCIIGFFWLLRPPEYLYSSPEEARSQAFLLSHIYLTMDGGVFPALLAPLNDESDLVRLTHANLEFSDQKNAVKGERIGHQATDDPNFCPAKALGHIALRLKRAGATHDRKIHEFYYEAQNKWVNTKPSHVTNALRHSAKLLEHVTGIDPAHISARSLRPGGATALLCACVDKDSVQLLGRWKSDAMLRYLRIQAAIHSHHYAQRMLDHGKYTFAPQALSTHGAMVPIQAPRIVQILTGALAHDEVYDYSDDEADQDS